MARVRVLRTVVSTSSSWAISAAEYVAHGLSWRVIGGRFSRIMPGGSTKHRAEEHRRRSGHGRARGRRGRAGPRRVATARYGSRAARWRFVRSCPTRRSARHRGRRSRAPARARLVRSCTRGGRALAVRLRPGRRDRAVRVDPRSRRPDRPLVFEPRSHVPHRSRYRARRRRPPVARRPHASAWAVAAQYLALACVACTLVVIAATSFKNRPSTNLPVGAYPAWGCRCQRLGAHRSLRRLALCAA